MPFRHFECEHETFFSYSGSGQVEVRLGELVVLKLGFGPSPESANLWLWFKWDLWDNYLLRLPEICVFH